MCQPRRWQQYRPTRDVAEPVCSPHLIVSGTELYPPSCAHSGGGTLCAPCLGVLVVTGWGFAAPGGLRGLGGQRERLQRAREEPHEGKGVKARKSWGETWRGESGARKPRAELSRRGRLCSHGSRSDARPLGCFPRSSLKAAPVLAEERSAASSRGGAGQCRAQEGSII